MKSVLLALVTVLLTGCITSPTKNGSKGFFGSGDGSITTESFEQKISDAKTIAIITDACVARDKIARKDYFSIKGSLVAASYMKKEAVDFLKKKGYKVTYHMAPFACGFKNPEDNFFVKLDAPKGASGEKSEMRPPFYVAPTIESNPAYSDSLSRLLHNAVLAIQQKKQPPSSLFLAKEKNLSDVQAVNEHIGGADLILLVMGHGKGVPWGKKAVQDIGTSVVSSIALSVLTGGAYSGSVSAKNVSYLDTYTGLIDPTNGEMIWAKSSRLKEFDPENEGAYKVFGIQKWAKQYFKNLPAAKSTITASAGMVQ